jgi:hypothetical protein
MHPPLNPREDDAAARGLTMVAWGKSMPIPSKPCPGELSLETQQLLRKTRDRAQWATYPCEVCGRAVGVEEAGGRWIPERHWPSVAYPPRKVPVRRIPA